VCVCVWTRTHTYTRTSNVKLISVFVCVHVHISNIQENYDNELKDIRHQPFQFFLKKSSFFLKQN